MSLGLASAIKPSEAEKKKKRNDPKVINKFDLGGRVHFKFDFEFGQRECTLAQFTIADATDAFTITTQWYMVLYSPKVPLAARREVALRNSN